MLYFPCLILVPHSMLPSTCHSLGSVQSVVPVRVLSSRLGPSQASLEYVFDISGKLSLPMTLFLPLMTHRQEGYILSPQNTGISPFSRFVWHGGNMWDVFFFPQTRETKTLVTVFGHIICSRREKVSEDGEYLMGISDHYVTYCTRKVVKECINRHNSVRVSSTKT